MNTAHGFVSAFAPQLEAYLAFKQAMGCYGTSRIWYLRRFDILCRQHDRTVFDRDTVEGWVLEQLGRSGRYRSWMSYLRDFGRWLQTHQNADAYVLSDRWKAGVVPARPYLLSTEDIDRFFTAAARLHVQSPWRWQAIAFFTLMHSCGIRTGAARALRAGQVDLAARHLDIVWAKGSRSRRLPVTRQVADVLAACDRAHAGGSPRGKPDVLDAPRPAPRRPDDLHRRRARLRLHRPHVRHRPTLRPGTAGPRAHRETAPSPPP